MQGIVKCRFDGIAGFAEIGHDNAELYGHKMTTKEVISSTMATPASATPLIALLSKYSPLEK